MFSKNKKQKQTSEPKEKKKLTIKEHGISIAKNILFFLIFFLILQTFMQRNMASGVAPAFNTSLINQTPVSLDDYKGKPLMLHFWAEWCPKCKLEEGSISHINRTDAQLITVAFQSGNHQAVKAILADRKITDWPVIVDEDGSLSRDYGVTGVPATFFIDASGNIRFKTIGLTSQWGMQLRLWLTSLYQ